MQPLIITLCLKENLPLKISCIFSSLELRVIFLNLNYLILLYEKKFNSLITCFLKKNLFKSAYYTNLKYKTLHLYQLTRS